MHQKTMTSHPPPPISLLLTFSECILSLHYTLQPSFSNPTLSLINQKPMKKINLLLRKCKSLSRQLGRSSSYSSLRSKSVKDDVAWRSQEQEDEQCVTLYVGSTRKRYLISSKYLKHPLLIALIHKQNDEDNVLVVKCEVVLFDHLLWMLENADPNNFSSESLDELVQLYAF